MKKILTFAFLTLVAFSCNKESEVRLYESPLDNNTPAQSAILTRAEYIANTISNSSNLVISEAEAKELLDVSNSHLGFIKSKSQSPSIKRIHLKNGVPDFYEFDSNGGFAIVSADKRIPEVLCITETGSLADTTFNKGLQVFMDGMRFYMDSMRQELNNIDSLKISAKSKLSKPATRYIPSTNSGEWYYEGQFTTNYKYNYYEYNIPVKWNQTYPYNDLLPLIPGTQQKAYTGCVMTAVAQIMAYHKKTYNTHGIYSSDWNEMIANRYDSRIAKLFNDLFYKLKTKYNTNGTSAYVHKFNEYDAADFLRDNGYIVGGYIDYSYSDLVSVLKNGPTIMDGISTSSGTGHAWVIEGTSSLKSIVSDRYSIYYEGEYMVMEDTLYELSRHSVKINWGWGGQSDGWFSSDAFLNYNHDNNMLSYLQ